MFRLPVLVVCCTVLCSAASPALAAAAATSKVPANPFAVLDQLDALDRAEMLKLLDEAMQCLSTQNLGCADAKITQAKRRAHGPADQDAIKVVADAVASERAYAAQVAEQERQYAMQVAEEQARQQREEQEEREAREQREHVCRDICFSLENQSACIERIISPAQCRQIEGTDSSDSGPVDIGQAQIIDNLKRAGRTLNQLGNQQVQAMQELAQQRRQAQEDAQRELQRRRETQAQQAEERRQAAQNAAQERQFAAQAQQQARQQALQAAQQAQDEARARRATEAKERMQAAQAQDAERRAASEAKFKAEAAEKQRVAKAEQDKAAAEARKAADAQADLQAKQTFLDNLARGTQLTTKVCYGDTFVVGIRPKIKPEKVACVDVEYRVQCPGAAPIDGVGLNFVGIGTDCFTGDTFDSYKVRPSCKDPAVSVRKFTECR